MNPGGWRKPANFAVLRKRRQVHYIVNRYRFNRLSRLSPCAQASDDHERVESMFPQHVRHTGAGGFARSSTVDINVFVLGQQLELLLQVIRFQPNRSLDAGRAGVVVAMTAYIDQQNVFRLF